MRLRALLALAALHCPPAGMDARRHRGEARIEASFCRPGLPGMQLGVDVKECLV